VPPLLGVSVGFFTVFSLYKLLYSENAAPPISMQENADGIKACINTPFKELHSFDSFAEELKEKGIRQHNVENRYQEVVWDTLDGSKYYPVESDKGWGIIEYGRGLKRDIASWVDFMGRIGFTIENFAYVHTRIDRLRGLQFAGMVRDMHNRGSLLNIRTNNKMCEVSKLKVSGMSPIYLVLPYSNRPQRLRLLLDNVSALRRKEYDIKVVICILEGAIDDEVAVQPFLEADYISLSKNSGDKLGTFSRAIALREAVRDHVPSATSVVFFCDVDLIISQGFVERCARNTISTRQVYYPVFYSLYPYADKIAQFNGFWRVSSYGMVCITKGDFDDLDAFGDAETRFVGWGSEDVYLWEAVRNSSLVAFRAVEPGLLHRWHSKKCDKTSKDFWNCMKTNFITMGHPLRIGPQLVQSVGSEDKLYELAKAA